MPRKQDIQLVGEELEKYCLQKTFYFGTEVEEYRNIFKYQWKFPLLRKISEQFVDILKAGQSILIFGQTEPIQSMDEKLIQRPIINIVVSDHQVNKFSAACTSVQSTDVELVKLSSYEVSARWHLIGKDKPQENAPRNLYYIRIVEAPSLNKIEQHKKDDLTQYFTFSNFFIDCQEAYKTLYQKVIKDDYTTTFMMKYNDQEHEISIDTDIIDDQKQLEYWAKFYYLKYWERPQNFDTDLNLDKIQIKQEIMDAFVKEFKEHGLEERNRYQEQKEEMQELLDEQEPQYFKIYKCYGHCDEAKVPDLFSPVVNRFLGKAIQYE